MNVNMVDFRRVITSSIGMKFSGVMYFGVLKTNPLTVEKSSLFEKRPNTDHIRVIQIFS
jgi:hypothetical protein